MTDTDKLAAVTAERDRLMEFVKSLVMEEEATGDSEYWEWGNYDDVYCYGVAVGESRISARARALLASGGGGGEECLA